MVTGLAVFSAKGVAFSPETTGVITALSLGSVAAGIVAASASKSAIVNSSILVFGTKEIPENPIAQIAAMFP